MSKNIIALLVYAIGMGAFFLAEIIIASFETSDTISSWASLKSFAIIGSMLTIIGLDQVMIRLPQEARGLVRYASIISISISFFYVLGAYNIGYVTDPVKTYIVVVSLSLGVLFSGYFRSRFELLKAQLCINLWKIVFLSLTVFLVLVELDRDYVSVFVVSTGVSLTFTAILFLRDRSNNLQIEESPNTPRKEQFMLGYRFLISIFTLNLSLHLEQILLNVGGHTKESAIYFIHVTMILPIIIGVYGYVGFVLAPYIRKNKKIFDDKLSKYMLYFLLFSLSVTLVSYVVSLLIHDFFIRETHEYNLKLGLAILFLGFLRLLYVFPSSYLGVHATDNTLKLFNNIGWFGVVLMVAMYFFLNVLFGAPLESVVFAVLLNWTVRTSGGYYLTWKTYLSHLSVNCIIK